MQTLKRELGLLLVSMLFTGATYFLGARSEYLFPIMVLIHAIVLYLFHIISAISDKTKRAEASSQTAIELARDFLAALEDMEPTDVVILSATKISDSLFMEEIATTAIKKPIAGQSRGFYVKKVQE